MGLRWCRWRRLWIVFSIVMVLEAPLYAGEESAATRDVTSSKSLSELLEELRASNPNIQAASYDADAARNRISVAGSLEDPRLEVEAMDIPTKNFEADRAPMDGVQFSLMQALPFPGKRKLMREVASLEAESRQAAYSEKINEVISEFKGAYYEYAYTAMAVGLMDRSRRALNASKTALETEYAAAKVMQSDVLRVGVELSSIDTELIMLRNAKKRSEARLSALLNRPVGTPFHAQLPKETLTPLSHSLLDLLALAKANRPLVKQATLAREQSVLEQRLAKQSLLPDLGLSASYRVRAFDSMDATSSENFVSAGVELNLPIWAASKQKKMISEAASMRKSRDAMEVAQEREVLYDIESMYSELDELKAQVALYRNTLLPKANAMRSAIERNYEANMVPYRDVIMSERDVLDYELMAAALRFDYEKKLAQLERMVGMSLASPQH